MDISAFVDRCWAFFAGFLPERVRVPADRLYRRYADAVPYLFFGVCSTVVNLGAYWIAAHPLGWPVLPSTVLAWVLAVAFAYVTNRKWVFHSEARGAAEIGREAFSFLSCRLATGVVDWLCMYLFVDVARWPDMPVKFFANVLVVILNYVASRLVIFRKKSAE